MVSFETAILAALAVLDGAEIERVGTFVAAEVEARMRSTLHGDDAHHTGESVWDHTREVYENLGFSVDSSNELQRLGAWAAILHDVGKVWTRKEKEDKVVFYKHARFSALVAGAFRERMDQLGESMRLRHPGTALVDMILWHERIINLTQNRKPDFSHVSKAWRAMQNQEVRDVFCALVRSDCTEKSRAEKEEFAKFFADELLAYEEYTAKQQKEKAEQEGFKKQCFRIHRTTIQDILVQDLVARGEELHEAETFAASLPMELDGMGPIYRELGKKKMGGTIKKIRKVLA